MSGGTIENPIDRDEEWRVAQAEVEAQRRAKEEADKQNDGKSLYEVLQANKGDARLLRRTIRCPTDMLG